jgi:methylenetetrahydrofolate--tRNA-(uracil-5-)-methyltransferase
MLLYPEQKKIFSLIPGLENADFLRYGSIHRNTYLNTPKICNVNLSLINAPSVWLAGQIAGVEGYVESIYSGLLTANLILDNTFTLPPETIIGQLFRHLITPSENFLPMNANFGLLPEIIMEKKNKPLKKELLSKRSLDELIRKKFV